MRRRSEAKIGTGGVRVSITSPEPLVREAEVVVVDVADEEVVEDDVATEGVVEDVSEDAVVGKVGSLVVSDDCCDVVARVPVPPGEGSVNAK